MRFTTSCFNPTLFRKNITRFWPVWAIYGIIWAFILPVELILRPTQGNNLARQIYRTLGNMGVTLAFLFAILAAMAVFSYLYHSRSVQMLHALPVKRECLFLTNYLSGLSFLMVPLWLVGLATLAIQGALGLGAYGTTVLWLFLSTLEVLFFYSFAVFCAMFTGHLLALPAFYVILNFLAMGLYSLLSSLFSQFVYGFSRLDWLDNLALWMTPYYRLSQNVWSYYPSEIGTDVLRLDGIPSILLYGLVGLVLAGLALFSYRKRKLESAGDVVSIRWVRPIFKYGVAFCAAIFLGSLLHNIFYSVLPSGMWPLLCCLLVAGAAGYFAAEMLLRKSFKVFRKGWKGVVAFSLALILLATSLEFDLFGFQRVPNSNAVASVSLSGVSSSPDDDGGYAYLTFTSKSDISLVLELHRQINAQKSIPDHNSSNVTQAVSTTPEVNLYIETSRTVYLRIDYTLHSGKVLHRAYDVPIYAADLETPGTVPYLLNSLLNRPSQYYNYYFGHLPTDRNLSLIDASIDLFNPDTGLYDAVAIKGDEGRDALLTAIKLDMRAGDLGRRYLFNDLNRYETCAVGDLTLTFYTPNIQDKPVGDMPYATKDDTWTVRITPQTTAKRTLEVLRSLGIIDDTHLLLTHAQDSDRSS